MLTADQRSVESASGTFSVTAALAVVNAILTSFATSASPSTVTSFTGALAGNLTGTVNGATGINAGNGAVGRTITVTTSASAATYKTGIPNGIVVTGTDYAGNAQTETLALTNAGGGETVVGAIAWKSIASIVIPGQNNTSGAFQFGVQDIKMPGGCRSVRVGVAGNLHVGYSDGSTDVIPSVLAGEYLPARPTTVFGDALTTGSAITVCF